MDERKIVSIISPCYNGETYIARFLESVLCQTYDNIELFVIDDGSTDKTKEILREYINRFKNRGYRLINIFQQHEGQASAINKALQVFNGDYMTWMDSDDMLKPNSIQARVSFLDDHPEFQFCICKADFVSEANINKVLYTKGRHKPEGEDQFFMDLIMEKNVMFSGGGGCFVRRDTFFEACPSKKIYPSIEGQNWQLMLPLAYKYKCGYVDDSLYTVVIRENSHSLVQRDGYQWLQRYENFKDLFSHVFVDMKLPNVSELVQLVNIKYAHRELALILDYDNKIMAKKNYEMLKYYGELSGKDKLFYFFSKYRIFIPVYKILRRGKCFLSNKI